MSPWHAETLQKKTWYLPEENTQAHIQETVVSFFFSKIGESLRKSYKHKVELSGQRKPIFY